MKYVTNVYCPKEALTKYDLNRTQDKRVIYITLWLPRYVTDTYCPKEAPCQMYSEYHLKQRSYKVDVTISN